MAVVFFVSLNGCAVVAPALPQHIVERSAKFEIGKATYSEIVAELGSPQGSGVVNGIKRIAYIDGYYGGMRIDMEFNAKDVLITKLNTKF